MRHLVTAFNAGELDPLMMGRVDTEHYASGLQLCENWVPVNEGPIIKRPGFEYVCDADVTASWLGAFRFSITQEYVIEWGATKARFYTNGGRIETAPGVAYEITTPYAAADAPMLCTQQSYDRLYIDHAAYPPARLSRTGAETFVHSVSPLTGGPFLDQNIDEAISVTASAVSGSGITLTATSAIWQLGDIGGLFRIEAQDFSDLKAWEPGMDGITIGEIIRSDGKAYQAVTAGATGSVQPVHVAGAEWDGQGKNDKLNAKGPYGVKWQYLHDRFGFVTITGFTTATSVTCDVVRRLPGSVASIGSWRWAHGAFSTARGWPSLVTNWAGRQLHIKDYDLFGSVVGDYLNHATRDAAGLLQTDLAFRRTLATEDPPLWVAGDRKLILGTASKELEVGAINAALAVSGDNISAEPQSFYGSERVFPVQIGTETIFIERAGRRVRSAGYDFARDRYIAADMTATCRHVTQSGIIQLAFQRVPYALLYGVRSDGQLIVHADTRAEMKGFARTVLGGEAQALSAVSVVGADGKADELWLLVNRTTPGGPRREIWRQTAWRDIGDPIAESFFVDAGVRVDASGGQTHFTGAVHLASQPVAVLCNGGVIRGVVVAADGSFDLPPTSVPATDYVLIVGLAYSARAVTLRPELRVNNQTSQGLKQRVVRAIARVLETLGLKAGSTDGPLEEMIDRPGNAAMDHAIPLKTGDVIGQIDASFDRTGQMQFISADPLPAIITATIANIDVDARDE